MFIFVVEIASDGLSPFLDAELDSIEFIFVKYTFYIFLTVWIEEKFINLLLLVIEHCYNL
jgi:hypothetical protein